MRTCLCAELQPGGPSCSCTGHYWGCCCIGHGGRFHSRAWPTSRQGLLGTYRRPPANMAAMSCATCCMLCMLFVVGCVLSAVCCLLHVACCCLLSIARCLLCAALVRRYRATAAVSHSWTSSVAPSSACAPTIGPADAQPAVARRSPFRAYRSHICAGTAQTEAQTCRPLQELRAPSSSCIPFLMTVRRTVLSRCSR